MKPVIVCQMGVSALSLFSVNNGVRQRGLLSSLLFNVYIDDLSDFLSKLPVGYYCGKTVVNHLMYADDIVLLAVKGLQKLLDASIFV